MHVRNRARNMHIQNSHRRFSVRKGVLRQTCNFIKIETLAQVFSCEFCEISWHRCFPVNFAKFLRTPLLQNTSGRLLLHVKIYNAHKMYVHLTLYKQIILNFIWSIYSYFYILAYRLFTVRSFLLFIFSS